MSSVPFYYYLSNDSHPLTAQSPLWSVPLPLNPSGGNGGGKSENEPLISYGDVFSGITAFLSQNRFKPLRLAAEGLFGDELDTEKLDGVRVFLVKHGEYYHPARIETDIGGICRKQVVNVAVSEAGLSFINKEFEMLQGINRSFPYSYIPRVFESGEILTDQGKPIRMFIGEWFDGFYEFHLSLHPKSNTAGIIVWNDDGDSFFLNETQTVQLFEQSAQIVTSYYNPFTFEHIFSWHHAAGDFILKQEKNHVTVRLVTIRDYAPMMKDPPRDLGNVLDGLLLFFLNLTLRLGLDRLDGIGEVAWAGKPAVKGAVAGFFKGLALQTRTGRIPKDLIDSFKSYLNYFSPDDLFAWATDLVKSWHPKTPGIDLVNIKLHDYIALLHSCIRHFCSTDLF